MAISAAVTLSLLVSTLVIPSLSKKLLQYEDRHPQAKLSFIARLGKNLFGLVPLAAKFNELIVSLLKLLFASRLAQLLVVLLLTIPPVTAAWKTLPKTEYLPEGDQNVIIGMMLPPQGYNIQEMHRIGNDMEKINRPYWEASPNSPEEKNSTDPLFEIFYL